MWRERRHRIAPLALVLLGLVALSATWLATRRPSPAELHGGARFLVTSGLDRGPGSLREAIFAADRASGPASIVLDAPRVRLKSPLPPLVNRHGVVIDATASGCEIDARALPEGPVLELQTPGGFVAGLKVRGAAGTAILVRAGAVHVRGVEVGDCTVGVALSDDASDLVIEASRFTGNGTGVSVAPGAERVTLRTNRFSRHDRAAIWAVAPRPGRAATPKLFVRENDFEDDRISVVLINEPAILEHNEFRRAREAAAYLGGEGLVVRDNRAREGARFGVFADETEAALVERNEIDRNAAVGILLRSSRASLVRGNRIYRNGYGIVVVFGDSARPSLVADNLLLDQREDGLYIVGGSPQVRDNRALKNGAAVLRILDFFPWKGPRVTAEPLLRGNVLEGNRFDEPVRGEFHAPPPKEREPS